MQILLAVGVLAGGFAALYCLAHGYATTVEEVALRLKQHAGRVRAMQERQRASVSAAWVRELEGGRPQ